MQASSTNGLLLLGDLLGTHIQQLKTLRDEIAGKAEYAGYPIRALIVFYEKDIAAKIKSRIKAQSHKQADEQKGNQEMVVQGPKLQLSATFSDILIFNAHKLVSFSHRIRGFIASMDKKTRNEVGISLTSSIHNRAASQLHKAHSLGALSNGSNISPTKETPTSMNDIDPTRSSFVNVTTMEDLLREPLAFLAELLPQFVSQTAQQYAAQKNLQYERKSLQLFLQVYQRGLDKMPANLQPNEETTAYLQELQSEIKMQFYDNVSVNRLRIARRFCHRLLFVHTLRLRTKKANKRLNERKQRIKQLITGEKSYINVLRDYIQYIKRPIQASQLVQKQDLHIMFSTIEEIMGLHVNLEGELGARFGKFEKYTKFSDILIKRIPFFKYYTEYIYYADRAQQKLIEYTQKHKEIQEICSRFVLEKSRQAADELKQPTFRIAKYELLLNDMLKSTNPIHPDYEGLKKALKFQQETLREINAQVGLRHNRDKMNALQNIFPDHQIVVDRRVLIEQFVDMYYIHEEKQEPVTIYVFNDILLIVDRKTIVRELKIDQGFHVRRYENNKTYKNIVKVLTDANGYMTFSAGNEPKHEKKANEFYQTVQKQSKQQEVDSKKVIVQVIGTEEIGSTSFAKHTEYIIEISYLGVKKTVHMRFSDMQPLVTKVQEHYHNNLNISREEALKKNWFNNHKSKTIESRKNTIEQILQKMLNHELVKKEPIFILRELKIDENFFKKTEQYYNRKAQILKALPSEIKKQKQGQQKQSEAVNLSQINQKQSRLRKKQTKEAETILCATEIKLGRDLFHDIDDSDGAKSNRKDLEKIQIQIHTMVNEEPIQVNINEEYTVEDVCHKVSRLIGLRMNRDFRLFHEIGKKQLRVLDQEQKITKIFAFPRNEANAGFISGLVGSVKKIVSPATHPRLIFKKYYFLPIQNELSECRKDLTRLRLLVYQIFSEIKEMKYQLHFDEYLLFLAMLVYIECDGQWPEDIKESYVHRLIPETIFKLKNYTEEQWLEKCRPHLLRLREEINKIIDHNREQLKNKKIKPDSISKTALHFGHRHLCSQIVINKIKSNTIYGSNLFYVQPHKDTFDKLKQKGKHMAFNMWLAIKVEGLNILTPSTKEPVLGIKYNQIENIEVFCESITFKMDGLETIEYRFNTYQSFQISQLVKYNKCLNDTLLELERNEDLISKAMMYKQESLVYRKNREEKEGSGINA